MTAGSGGPGGEVDVVAAAESLGAAFPSVPRTAVVVGSGLGALERMLSDPVAVPFADLPGLPAPTVEGHGGRFVHGSLDGVDVLLQAGRYHVYEGHPMSVVAAPVRILALLGVENLVLTNAAGSLDPLVAPGDIVLLDDVINLTFRSPLVGPRRETPAATDPTRERAPLPESPFPDMSRPFDAALAIRVREAASSAGVRLGTGVYAAVHGPSYETRAEVRMLRRLGADLVGMSTVPEVVTAAAIGLRCVAMSLVTNAATGLGEGAALSHDEVLEVGREAGERMVRVLTELVGSIERSPASDGSAGGQSGGAK